MRLALPYPILEHREHRVVLVVALVVRLPRSGLGSGSGLGLGFEAHTSMRLRWFVWGCFGGNMYSILFYAGLGAGWSSGSVRV